MRPMVYNNSGALIFFAALEREHHRTIGEFLDADDFLVETKRDADAAHLILQRLDDFAVDKFQQSRPALDQHHRNA